jgi:glycosyltransferase involved in cell wall biosynthesis
MCPLKTSDPGKRRIWLADHLLRDLRGHHFNYNLTLAAAARSAGWQTSILCRKAYDFNEPKGVDVLGIFRKDWRNEPAPWLSSNRPALDLLEAVSRRRFYADLWSGFPAWRVSSSDIVFAQMLAPRHLEGWLCWLEKLPDTNAPVLALHLGYDPWRFTHDRGVREALVRVNRRHPSLVHYITDSERLAPHYQKIFGSRVDVLPHVVPRDLSSKPRIQSGKIVFTCAGNPRREKGFVELTSAILRILHEEPRDARFVVQINDPDSASLKSVSILKASRLSGLELVESRLSEQQYLKMLDAADVFVLPYHLDKYRDRTSGIFCEALVAGKPVVTIENSWMSAELSRAGLGWLLPERNVDALVETIRRAVREYEVEARKSLRLAPQYRVTFSGENFLQGLFRLANESIK